MVVYTVVVVLALNRIAFLFVNLLLAEARIRKEVAARERAGQEAAISHSPRATALRRTHEVARTTMPSSSAAPCRSGDPRTGLSSIVRSTSRRSLRFEAPATESHVVTMGEALTFPLSQFVAPRCVHLLELRLGKVARSAGL